MRRSVALWALVALSVPLAVLCHGDASNHICIHDHLVSSTRKSWKARGLKDHFERDDLSFTVNVPQRGHGRNLNTYAPIRIQIMTDLLEDGAYVPVISYVTCCRW